METLQQRQRVEAHIENAYGTPPEHLWERYPDYAVFRHPGSRKWYAITMLVPARVLGLEGEQIMEIMNLKCGHVLLGPLLNEAGFLPAYHMSKTNWVSVLLDGTVPDEKLFSLLEISYDSVSPKRKNRPRE